MGKKSRNTGETVNDRQAKINAAAEANKVGPNKILIGTIVALVAIIAVVAAVIISDQRSRPDSTATGSDVPAAAAGMGEGFVANEDVTLQEGAPTIDIYEDFRCPYCHTAHAIFHDTVKSLADEGKAQVVYHFKTVIDTNAGGDQSLKAASSAMCAADAGKFNEYHDEILTGIVNAGGQQPNWGPQFFTSSAESVGITGAELQTFNACVRDGKYDAYIESTEAQSRRDNVMGTPVYKVGGEELDLNGLTPEALVQAVENATGQ